VLTERDIQIANNDVTTYDLADGSLYGNVLANDVFLRSAGYPAAITLETPPEHGSVVFYPDFDDPYGPFNFYGPGAFKYTPESGYTGEDSFTYKFTGSDGPAATVAINHPGPVLEATVVPTGDYGVRSSNMWSTGYDQTLTVNSIVYSANERDGGLLASNLVPETSGKYAEVVTSTSHGTLNVDSGSGSFTYDPDPGFGGWDTFIWRIHGDENNPNAPRSHEATGWIYVEPLTVSIAPVDANAA
jgi:hypothetical protein